MAFAGMVQDIVHIDLDSLCVRGVDQVFEILLGAVFGVEGGVIPDVVAVVRVGGMRRREPDGGDSKAVQVIQALLDSLEVTDLVSVAVREAINQKLVSDVTGLFTGGVLGNLEIIFRDGSGRIRLAGRKQTGDSQKHQDI